MENIIVTCIVTCPKCGYNLYGPEQWGCFRDRDLGQKPETCVIDENRVEDCIYAQDLLRAWKGRSDCEYWRKW